MEQETTWMNRVLRKWIKFINIKEIQSFVNFFILLWSRRVKSSACRKCSRDKL